MRCKFSIVMPVYQVEPYLSQAVDSVLNQTCRDFELILVDDASPDRCGEICQRYATADSRVKVIHHTKNQGLSAARNTGMRAAEGEFIWFMDSDDYVDPDLLEQAARSLELHDASLVVFGLTEEHYQKGRLVGKREILPARKNLDTREEIRDAVAELEEKTLYGYAWNKIYSLDRIRECNLEFESITLIEDILFNIRYCMDIDRINLLDTHPYHYNKRYDSSLTTKYVENYYELHEKRIRLLYKQQVYWQSRNPHTFQMLARRYTRYLLSALQRNCMPQVHMTAAERYRWVRKVYRSRFFPVMACHMKPENLQEACYMSVVKGQHILLSLLMGRLIYLVKIRMPGIFVKALQKY